MKPFKTFGSLVLLSSTLFLAASCSKDMGGQSAKGEKEVGKFTPVNCAPFLGLQTRQNSMGATFAYLGDHKSPIETQAFYGSDFSATNLLAITATGGTPYYDPQYIRIGVGDQWINGSEVLKLKIQNGKAAKRMVMQYKSLNAVATASFFLAGLPVGSAGISGSGISGLLDYEAKGDVKEFDEVQFSVTNGKLAITGFTPNEVTPGPSGFFLVEQAGTRVIMRFRTGNTLGYPNQYFNMTTNYAEGPANMRQNRYNTAPVMGLSSGEFTNSGSPVIPGSKTFVNISGDGPLVYRLDNYRLGVGNQFISGSETVTVKPGADFPGTKFRMAEFREATLLGSKLKITAYNGGVEVASRISAGTDGSYTLITSYTEFDEIRITWVSGTDGSIGRANPGPVGATMLLYPACP